MSNRPTEAEITADHEQWLKDNERPRTYRVYDPIDMTVSTCVGAQPAPNGRSHRRGGSLRRADH